MVDSLRGGFNSTILAYGDSGSGKTHTMIGPPGGGAAEVRALGRRWGPLSRELPQTRWNWRTASQQRAVVRLAA
jgi:hypothetical protein